METDSFPASRVQMVALYRQATIYYPGHCWSSFILPYGFTRPQWVTVAVAEYKGLMHRGLKSGRHLADILKAISFNSSPPGRDYPLFADDIFRYIFVNEKFRILVKISLNFVPEGPIDNEPALVQILAWRRIGDKPLSEPALTHSQMHKCGTKGGGVN